MLKTFEYALDMRESFFTKLQGVSLKIAKRNPGKHLMEMQELLV